MVHYAQQIMDQDNEGLLNKTWPLQQPTASFWHMSVMKTHGCLRENNPEDQSFLSASVNQPPANKVHNDLYPVCFLL